MKLNESPFVPNHLYQPIKDFNSHFDVFKKDEVLIYDKHAYSIYDGCTGFFFHPRDDVGKLKRWDLYNDEIDKTDWQDFFTSLP